MQHDSNDADDDSGPAIEIPLAHDEHDRLLAVTDDPAGLVREAALARVHLEETIEATEQRRYAGPAGFEKMVAASEPTWPLGSLLGLETVEMGDGESRWAMDVGPEHANPMGTVHGGVLCDLGDAAMGTAYMSTVGPDESFTTVDLTVNFLRPVRSDCLEAAARVVHRGRTVGLVECDVTNGDGDLVARLSSTCLTLEGERAAGR